jgi:hypothetical protein
MRPSETIGRFCVCKLHLISGNIMHATMTLDHSDLTRGLSHLQADQAPYAAARALTDTAWGAARGLKGHMENVFDNPTAFTKNAFRVIGAKKNNLEAQVLPKDRVAGRHYLFTQEEGGVRPQTGIEKLLHRHVPFEGILQTVVPAGDAKLNRSGNLSAAQIQRVLSGLGAQRDKQQNTSKASSKRQRSRETYFVPRYGLSPGVFARQSNGRLKMILAFTDRASRYRKRLGYEEFVTEYMADNFPDAFWLWLDRAMETRR